MRKHNNPVFIASLSAKGYILTTCSPLSLSLSLSIYIYISRERPVHSLMVGECVCVTKHVKSWTSSRGKLGGPLQQVMKATCVVVLQWIAEVHLSRGTMSPRLFDLLYRRGTCFVVHSSLTSMLQRFAHVIDLEASAGMYLPPGHWKVMLPIVWATTAFAKGTWKEHSLSEFFSKTNIFW